MLTLHPIGRARRQKGSTLIVTMMVLVLIMMLGVAAMVSSQTQFKLTGNLQFEDVAMGRAEATIALAESWLSTADNHLSTGFVTYSAASPHLHPIGHLAGLAAPNNNPLNMVWSDANSLATTSGDDSQRYIIERVSKDVRLLGSGLVQGDRANTACNRVNTYLVTARGTSTRGATKFIQSYYSVLSC